MITPSSLQNQVAIITGGGTGIGLAIALRLGELGARIVVGSRDSKNLERGHRRLCATPGLDPLAVQIDVRKPDQVDEMVDARRSGTSAGSTSSINNAAGNFICQSRRSVARTAGTRSSASC